MCRRSEPSTFGLCRAADVRRSGPGPARRAHEAAQRQTQFLDHVLFTEPLEPDTGKPCENSLKTHLIVPLFFLGECDPKRFDVGTFLTRGSLGQAKVRIVGLSRLCSFLCDVLITRRAKTTSVREGAGPVLGVGGAQEEQGWERLGL